MHHWKMILSIDCCCSGQMTRDFLILNWHTAPPPLPRVTRFTRSTQLSRQLSADCPAFTDNDFGRVCSLRRRRQSPVACRRRRSRSILRKSVLPLRCAKRALFPFCFQATLLSLSLKSFTPGITIRSIRRQQPAQQLVSAQRSRHH